jgi:hypothetical protein
VGTIKSIGCIYQRSFLGMDSKLAFATLYDRKKVLVTAELKMGSRSLSLSEAVV